MQTDGIANAFAAWQRAHQKLTEAELRLESATLAYQRGLAPPPDSLRTEVAGLKAEQDWRYDLAADSLRRRNTRPASAAPSETAASRGSGSFHRF